MKRELSLLCTALLLASLAQAETTNALKLELQRPVDARLAKIATGQLARGEAHVVHNASEVRALSGKLKPGDQLVLAGAEWKDTNFSFEGHGEFDAPIVVRPEMPDGAVFTGSGEVGFYGSNLIVTGLTFRKVDPAKNHGVIFRLGSGVMKPADHCIVHRVTFDHCGSSQAEDWPKIQLWLMTVRGQDNTIADCLFDGFSNIGQMIGAGDLPPEGLQRLHILNNRFRDRPKIDNQNGYEIIQIGWSGEKARSAGSLIEGNTFERCDGENEVITLKASDVVVRRNQFLECQGVLSLRATNRVLVEENVFDGKGRENTGGITAEGADHVITHNIFRDLRKPRNYYYWTLATLSGSAENYGDNGDVAGYGRAKNILITNNRFERCDARIAAGCYPRKEYPLLPVNIRVEHNVFVGMKTTSPFDFVAPDPSGALAGELHESDNEFRP